jgi:hypothetical protein
MGRDDQPTDADGGRLDDLPGHETDAGSASMSGQAGSGDERDTGDAVAPSVVDFDDHERTDVDDPAKPGIDDYAS